MTVTVNACGLLCPAPVIALARAAKELGSGVVVVLADDPAARSDIPAWCRMRAAELVAMALDEDSGVTTFTVRVGVARTLPDPPNALPDDQNTGGV